MFAPRTNLPLTATPLYGIGHKDVVPNVGLGAMNAFWGAETLH